MAVRNLKPQTIERWRGHDSFTNIESVGPDVWPSSLNFIVAQNGNAVALRSPANFNTALSTTNKVLSAAYYAGTTNAQLIFDINNTSGANVRTYATATGGTNSLLRSSQADARFVSLNVANNLYRTNGSEYVQIVPSNSVYLIGIAAPAAAPTISFVAGGTGSILSGVTVSYAYRNSTTGHIGLASDPSATSGANSPSSNTLRIATVASTADGVDGIVTFISEDGGTLRYLLIDSNDDPVVQANATANVDISIAAILTFLNTNVEETQFNNRPIAGATVMWSWRNRVMFGRFTGATTKQTAIYSGFDQITYGVPYETYPSLNVLPLPVKNEWLQGGIETPIGCLILSDLNAYILGGEPTDKVDSGENTLQPTEQMDQLGWKIGTRSPLTMKNTPFGTIWLDQDKHIQFWPWSGQPTEVCIGLRDDLNDILDTDAARFMAEGEWFSSGVYGGFYILTASTSGSTNNRTWFITVVKDGDNLFIGGAPSDMALQCLAAARLTGVNRMFAGITDRVRELLLLDTQGAGWPSGTEIYFDMVANNNLLWSTLNGVVFNGTNLKDFVVQVRTDDDTSIRALNPQKRGGSYSAFVNKLGTSQKLRFLVQPDDYQRHEISKVDLLTQPKKRGL